MVANLEIVLGIFFFLIHSLVDYISQVLELCWYFFGSIL
jgi:hypothetical protein